ncbi:MAG: transposase [Bacteroidales bacterium]|nr:transposase [Bacteroidales bacterium]
MKKRRRFYKDAATHVYQRAVNGFNIFYTMEDRLVFCTVFSHFAKKCGIDVLALCLMVDHIHVLVQAESREKLSSFVLLYTSLYARLFNASRHREGQLFVKSFGSAPKSGDKKIRTTISYIFNNPVEKDICPRAEDYRWNFLAYASSPSPFSVSRKTENMSRPLRRAIAEVRKFYGMDMYLGYNVLRRIFHKLAADDRERLADYVISLYNPIRYDVVTAYYGSYEDMLTAVNSNTGSEYDLKEEYNPYSDSIYQDMSDYLQFELKIDPWLIPSMTVDEKIRVAGLLKSRLPLTNRQLCKYLHMVPAGDTQSAGT